jgi:hypothetical protein
MIRAKGIIQQRKCIQLKMPRACGLTGSMREGQATEGDQAGAVDWAG